MTDQMAKRRKLTNGKNTDDIVSVAVGNSYSVVVEEGIVTREVMDFNVPKRTLFLQALKATSKKDTIIPGLKFGNVCKSVASAFELCDWELWLGSVAYVCIYHGIKIKDLVASCQLQFMSKGEVEREGPIVTEKEATVYPTKLDPDKHRCLSYRFSVKDLWTETTDQIRVILTFPLPIQLFPPVQEEVYDTESYMPSFEAFFLSDDFSDISVSSNSNKWPAHKNVLAHCSDVFKRMLQTEMKEAQEGNIKLDEFDPRAVKEMLRYVYTGKLEATSEIYVDIFKLGHTYEIKGLKGKILPMIVNSITLETAPQMYSFGELYNTNVVMTRALSIAKANKKSMVKDGKQFKTLAETHPNFMFKLWIQD